MTNLSEKTRKQLVLDALRNAGEGWVSTAELSSAAVGGSEGMRRKRELEADGYVIEKRKRAGTSQFEYRLASPLATPQVIGLGSNATQDDVRRFRDEWETALPFVQWKRSAYGHSYTASYKGADLWVADTLGANRWVWRTSRDDLPPDTGYRETKEDAQRAAIRAAMQPHEV